VAAPGDHRRGRLADGRAGRARLRRRRRRQRPGGRPGGDRGRDRGRLDHHPGLRWANLAPGLWLLAGPALLGVPGQALASSLGAGVLVLALTPWGRGDSARFGGGWRSLLDRSRLAGAPEAAPPGRD